MIDRIQQLQQQYASAVIACEKLRKIAFADPEHGRAEAYLESRRSVENCRVELQAALRKSTKMIEELSA
ncbi:MAG: hypothetical protein EOM22_12460 [Gammaproteobacteria bacterium]|nr:hypothetical protein [Gammaproteobacteria bacterium]